MSAQWLPMKVEAQPAAKLSGEGRFLAELARIWLCLAIGALAVALCWRIIGSAPPLQLVLDYCGLALFAAALWLLPTFENLLESQQRHVRAGALWPGQLSSALLRLLVGALTLALAPAPLLLAYSAREMAVRVDRLNAPALLFPLPLLFIASLLLGGTLLVLASCLLLHLLRRLCGLRLGSLLWLTLLLLFNMELLSTLPAPVLRQTLPQLELLNGSGRLPQFPGLNAARMEILPGPGSYLDFSMSTLANQDAALTSLPQFASVLFSSMLLKIAFVLLLLVGAMWLPPARRRIKALLCPLSFAAAGSVLFAALLSLLAARAWTELPALRFPGDYHEVTALSLICCLNLLWLLLRVRPPMLWRGLGQGLLMLLLAPLAWTLCSMAAISADQAVLRELLASCLAALLILAVLGLALIRLALLAGRLHDGWSFGLSLALLALINLPPTGTASLPLQLYSSLAAALGQSAVPAWAAVVGLLLLLTALLLLWPLAFSRRRLRATVSPAA